MQMEICTYLLENIFTVSGVEKAFALSLDPVLSVWTEELHTRTHSGPGLSTCQQTGAHMWTCRTRQLWETLFLLQAS